MSKAIKEVAVEEAVETVVERPYTLRKFNDGDLFPILKILKKIGIKYNKQKKPFISKALYIIPHAQLQNLH